MIKFRDAFWPLQDTNDLHICDLISYTALQAAMTIYMNRLYIYIYIYIYVYVYIYNYIYIYIYTYSEGTCPRGLLYHLFEAPVVGPWAHLGFEKKHPQSLNKRPTKAWGTNPNGLDVKLLSISRKTSKARVANRNGLDAKLQRSSWKTTKAWVANHNGLDAKLRRSLWKTTKAWVANHNGSDAKLLRMSLKIQEKKKILFLLFFEAFS